MNKNKRKHIGILLTLVFLALSATLVIAWYYREYGLVTLTQIREPGPIAIDGVHGQTIQSLNLSYSDEDVDQQGVVRVKSIVCIGSRNQDFYFQIGQTTNIKGLVLNIYPAHEVTTKPTTGKYEKGTYKGKDYYYVYEDTIGLTTNTLSNTLTHLDPLNWKDGKEESSTVAAATGDYHNDTYGAEENRVQVNAEPVYWRSFDPVKLSSSDQVFNGDSYDKNYAGFFIIEAIWNEKDKETDLVYLIAGETEEVNSVEEVK